MSLPLLGVLAVLSAPSVPPPEPADLVLKNGLVHTMDVRAPRAEAVAIRGSRIVAVGRFADVAPHVGPKTKVLDLGGRTVVPGFRENHAHFMGVGFQKLTVDLVGAQTWDEAVARVAAAAKGRAKGEWIVGRGWHEEKWSTPPKGAVRGFPTHDALSAAVPDHPVFLRRADGHAGIANAAALRLMAITGQTKAPDGGEIIRDERGRPTGVFVDNAQGLVKVPPPSAEQSRQAFALAQKAAWEEGITSFTDAGASLDAIALYKEEAAAGRLGVRLYVMVQRDILERWSAPEVGLGGGMLTIRAVKVVADGALGSRGAALLEPYSDDPGNTGLVTTPPEDILQATRYALAHGFQVAVHAIGDRANRLVLDTFEKALRDTPRTDHRLRIEHAQILDALDIPRFGGLAVIASVQGIHCTSDRPWAAARLGEARVAEGAYVWRKLKAAGATIVNGTDAPVEALSALASYHATVTREGPDGRPPGGFDPAQRLSREEALRSYTLDAAFAAFEERENGSLEAGKKADVVVLSHDILTLPEDDLLQAKVDLTIVDGRVRFERPGAGAR